MDSPNNNQPRGKEKAPDITTTNESGSIPPDNAVSAGLNSSANSRQTDASLGSRIQTSATHLSRAIFSARPDTSSLGSSSDKPQNSTIASAGPSSIERGESSQVRPVAPASNATQFRESGGASNQAGADYDAFLTGQQTAPSLHPDLGTYQDRTPRNPTTGLGRTDFQAQEARDGADVLDLLSAPDLLDMTEDPNIDPDLSPDEIEMLRRALFEGPSQRGTPNWDSLLNLAPGFLLAGDPDGTSQHLGITDNAEGINQWLDQWRDVLDNYTDEVWGDLGHLAQDARREVEAAKEQPPTAGQQGDLKALERLRQILAHVRG